MKIRFESFKLALKTHHIVKIHQNIDYICNLHRFYEILIIQTPSHNLQRP